MIPSESHIEMKNSESHLFNKRFTQYQIQTDILCTNCVQEFANNILFQVTLFKGNTQYIVEAGTGIVRIEKYYTKTIVYI